MGEEDLLQFGFVDEPLPEGFGVLVENEAFVVVEDVPAAETHLASQLAGSPTYIAHVDAQCRFLPSGGQCGLDILLRGHEVEMAGDMASTLGRCIGAEQGQHPG